MMSIQHHPHSTTEISTHRSPQTSSSTNSSPRTSSSSTGSALTRLASGTYSSSTSTLPSSSSLASAYFGFTFPFRQRLPRAAVGLSTSSSSTRPDGPSLSTSSETCFFLRGVDLARARGVDLGVGEPEVPLFARVVLPLRSLARRWDTAFALQSILVLVWGYVRKIRRKGGSREEGNVLR